MSVARLSVLVACLAVCGCDSVSHWISEPYSAASDENFIEKIAVVAVEVRHPTGAHSGLNPTHTVKSAASTSLGQMGYKVRDESKGLIEEIWRYNESRLTESSDKGMGATTPFFGLVIAEILSLQVKKVDGEETRWETTATVRARLVDVSSLKRLYLGHFSRTVKHSTNVLKVDALVQATMKALENLPRCSREVSEADIETTEKSLENSMGSS